MVQCRFPEVGNENTQFLLIYLDDQTYNYNSWFMSLSFKENSYFKLVLQQLEYILQSLHPFASSFINWKQKVIWTVISQQWSFQITERCYVNAIVYKAGFLRHFHFAVTKVSPEVGLKWSLYFLVFCPDATITGIIGKKLKPSLE